MVGGKGNEKTTSDGQRVCASVGVFWFPPSQVSTSRGEVAAGRLPSWSRALSLGLPVRTALEFGGLQRASAPPTQGLYPPHTHSSTTHTRAVLPRSDPYPSRASGRAARPPPLQPHPLPLPRLQMATPRARLTAPRRRPAAAGGRSPPSQLLRQDWGAWRAGRAPPLSPIGTEARPPSGTQELCSEEEPRSPR